MAEATLRAGNARRNPLTCDADPNDMPEHYASVCQGNCLEPVFNDGALIVFSKTDEPRVGDYVGIWLHRDAIAPGEAPRRVKRLVMGGWPGMPLPYPIAPGSEVEPLIVLDQLNPPRTYHVRASHILAMHKVIGEAERDHTGQARLVRQWIDGRMMRHHEE